MELRDKNNLTLREFLDCYDESKYRRPSVTVDMAVFTLLQNGDELELALMLIKRGGHPDIGRWALPGGFVDPEEELRDAAARELEEETGIIGLPMRQCGTFGLAYRDLRTRVISVAHYAIAPFGSVFPQSGDDAADADLFRVSVTPVYGPDGVCGYMIDLTSKRDTLHCRVSIQYDALGAYVKEDTGGALAADHDCIVFEALRALSALPRRKAAKLFTADHLGYDRAAEAALERALSTLP